MIHDVFFRRYPQRLFWSEHLAQEYHPLFMQIAHILFSDLCPALALDQAFFRQAHDKLAREAGVGGLHGGRTYDEMCGQFLIEPYDLWNDRHRDLDTFLKWRLSLVELLYRAAEQRAKDSRKNAPQAIAAVSDAVAELNARFRSAQIGLHYHNGIIQFSSDELTEERTSEPCWQILRDARWANVDRELKIAIDHVDSGHSDAAFHAAKALESTIKVISNEKGWSTGRENGAANYIDNLVSQKNGRYIDVWEADMLKAYFTHVRNPHGHGAGSGAPPTLKPEQVDWAVETAMAWIKNLVRRS